MTAVLDGVPPLTLRHWDDLEPDPTLWAILDGVAWPGLPSALGGSGLPHVCLYTTTEPEGLAAAPWLVQLSQDGGLMDDLRRGRGDDHRGILGRSSFDIQSLRRHFRHYTMIQTPMPGEMPQYYRFSDPRVMLDSFTALDPGLLGQLLSPFDRVLVPLSRQCLLPEGAGTLQPDIFDQAADWDDRLVELIPPPPPAELQRIQIDEASFKRFAALTRKRAISKLAKEIWDKAPEPKPAQIAARAAAAAAPNAAAEFGMTSKRQVTVMAQAILAMGDKFWTRDGEAERILTRPGPEPWQRKNDLAVWLKHVTAEGAQ